MSCLFILCQEKARKTKGFVLKPAVLCAMKAMPNAIFMIVLALIIGKRDDAVDGELRMGS